MTHSPDDIQPDAGPTDVSQTVPALPSPSSSPEYLDSVDGTVPSAEAGTEEPAARRPGRRRGLVVGAVLGVALVGGGVAYGVGRLSGGGAQPDEMIPASALAVVSVDLDPSAAQKIDALRFARKFPELKTRIGGGDDLRKVLFDLVSESGDVTTSWKDVEPWLGSRAAVAVLPAKDELDEPVPVVVVAVTDEAKAKTGLREVAPDARCEVADGFAVCAEDQDVATRAVADASSASLADDPTYAADMKRLGDHGVLAAWGDLGRVKKAAPDLLGGLGGVAGSFAGAGDELKGRYVAAVRFDGPHLELAGRAVGLDVPKLSGSTDVGSLPDDTLVALGYSSADALVKALWDQVHQAAESMNGAEELDAEVSSLADAYGVRVPDDVVAAVGSQLAVAVGPGTTPQLAVRVNGSRDSLDRVVNAVEQVSGGMVTVATATSGSSTVLASDQSYASAVAKGGALGRSERFTDAVGDAEGAQAVLFVDIAGLVASYGDQLWLDDADLEAVKPLSAVGLTVRQDGDALVYRARLATR